MTILATPTAVAVDATCLISILGPPDRAVYWVLGNSAGVLSVLHTRTDAQGRASAIFTPDVTDLGSVATVSATYGE